jgi:hypothetical protein
MLITCFSAGNQRRYFYDSEGESFWSLKDQTTSLMQGADQSVGLNLLSIALLFFLNNFTFLDAKASVIQLWKKYRPSSSSDSATIITKAKQPDQNAFIT